MKPRTTVPIPEVYVLWHPRCQFGEHLARRIHVWLRPGNGLGPQVFYRSLPAPDAHPAGLPPPLPGESRQSNVSKSSRGHIVNLQLVLVLADENMVADPTWRYWLAQLALAPSALGHRRLLVPVALDSTAFNLPPPLCELNFLRPSGLPVAANGSDGAREVVVRSLLKQLTEALCHVLLGQDDDSPVSAGLMGRGSAPKIKLFLSHAKADGTTPAKKIRDYIYSQTQLAAFYDENDIPYGSVFARVLQSNLDLDDTAALIAVRSARYASRPWCRRELSLFRRPVKIEPNGSGDPERWRLNPTLVVDALEDAHQAPGIPELGNTSAIRWSATAADQEEQIVTTVLRDVLLAAFHSSMGRLVSRDPSDVVINWLPDPTTLLQIPRVRENVELRIYYPGRGLSGLELDVLDELFPRVELRSFEEALQ